MEHDQNRPAPLRRHVELHLTDVDSAVCQGARARFDRTCAAAASFTPGSRSRAALRAAALSPEHGAHRDETKAPHPHTFTVALPVRLGNGELLHELEAKAAGVNPAPPPRGSIVLDLDGELET
jgi:hypothetical protein